MYEWLNSVLPEGSADLFISLFVITLAVIIVTQNIRILSLGGKLLGKLANFINKIMGRRVRDFNTKILRSAYLNKETLQYRIVKYFEDLIMNLDLHKDGVSVAGLIIFMLLIAFVITVAVNSFFTLGALFPLAYCAVFAVVFIIFKLVSLTHVEKREEMIMDAVDFLVSDIKGGVFNAMMRYEYNFNPAIRPYFSECIDDVKNKGASFEEAMLKLNAQLGITFTDFAYKAIIYEAKADDGLEDLFSSIIETNRNRRNLRYINNQEFNALKLEFLVSLGIIVAYAAFFMLTDAWAMNFISNTVPGRLMVIADVVIVAAVLAFITNIKAKSL